ncbi:MAG TPA: restriction endonuclease [Ideonella sp.]|uniref:restriction endonuclease n=1 Tax=Ideonella sp. TaxID=1929293 RepID=UPI002BBECA22|nr:restriction endonuclease [Ideonella sp.]HSI46987.1 restriction endonuclease [Ideonella sp.]
MSPKPKSKRVRLASLGLKPKAPPGRNFERLAAALESVLSPGAKIQWNYKVGGRQFDVAVISKFGSKTYITAIECKDYKSNISVEKVDAFVTKTRDAGIDRAIILTTKGFQSGARVVAVRHGIELIVLNKIIDEASISEGVAGRVEPVLVISNFRLSITAGEDFDFSESEGKEEFIRNSACLQRPDSIGIESADRPEDLIDAWWRLLKKDSDQGEAEIVLPTGTTFNLYPEYTDPISVGMVKFDWSVQLAPFDGKPKLERRLIAALNTRYDLVTVNGETIASVPVNKTPLGFDGTLEQGNFYHLPAWDNYYYCNSVGDATAHWLMLESYQHGQLIQSEWQLPLKYAGHYIKVTDAYTIDRLGKLLSNFQTVMHIDLRRKINKGMHHFTWCCMPEHSIGSRLVHLDS